MAKHDERIRGLGYCTRAARAWSLTSTALLAALSIAVQTQALEPEEAGVPILVERVRHTTDGTTSRVSIELSRAATPMLKVLPGGPARNSTQRLVLDFANALLQPTAEDPTVVSDPYLREIRTGQLTPQTARIVLDLARPATHTVRTLADPARVVVDLDADSGPTVAVAPTSGAQEAVAAAKPERAARARSREERTREELFARLRGHYSRALQVSLEKQRRWDQDNHGNESESIWVEPGAPIWIQAGKSRIIRLAYPVKRVSIGNPDLAGIVVLDPRTIMINAKPLPEEKRQEARRVGRVGIVSGQTLTPEPRVKETSIVVWNGTTDQFDVHALIIADFIDRQVMLEVTVAELRRSALEEHGIDVRAVQRDLISNFFMGGGAGPAGSGLTTVPPHPGKPLLPLTTSGSAPTYAFILPDENITGFIQALQAEGLATILAQPKLTALSGQNAVFQVGGEIPIRISSGFATDIVFKPFGTLVNFLPRVSDDGTITLTVTPEVSQPDFSNTVEGIPSFRTRRASTSTRLTNGQTLVIGGLLQTDREEEVRGVPYLMNIPVLGYIFRNTVYKKELTELMVVVTPHVVHPMVAGTEVPLPTDRGPLANKEINTKADPAEATRPRFPGTP